MSSQGASAARARQTCAARERDGLMLCERCGLEWLAGAAKPDCDPVTWKRMRSTLLHEIDRETASANVLSQMRRAGGSAVNRAAAPAACRRRAADLAAVLTLIDCVTASPRLKAAIAGSFAEAHGAKAEKADK